MNDRKHRVGRPSFGWVTGSYYFVSVLYLKDDKLLNILTRRIHFIIFINKVVDEKTLGKNPCIPMSLFTTDPESGSGIFLRWMLNANYFPLEDTYYHF